VISEGAVVEYARADVMGVVGVEEKSVRCLVSRYRNVRGSWVAFENYRGYMKKERL